MRRCILLATVFAVLITAVPPASAQTGALAFAPTGDGSYRFDTGVMHGRIRAAGRNQGVATLVDRQTGVELLHAPGALSYYRIFAGGKRFGDAARDWPTQCRVLEDGGLQMQFVPPQPMPLKLSAIYRWTGPDTLDVQTTVTADEALPRFEVFLSSYFTPESTGSVYVAPNQFESGPPRIIAADVNPLVDGTYLMFPRDRRAVQTVFDGRWEQPPHPVQWSVTRHLAAPLVVRRVPAGGLSVSLMAPPSDCFAVSAPYNKTPPDGPSGHASLYLSLFGQDLAAGQTVHARTRLHVGRNETDGQIIARYEAYLTE